MPRLKPAVRVPEARCPYCGEPQDGASGVREHYPQPGDTSICIECGAASVFDDSLQRKKWPVSKPIPPDIARYQALIREARGS